MKQCHFCGGELREQLTTFVHEDNGQVWVIRNVPAFICSQCGEKEYTQETTHNLLSFLKQPPRPAEILHVPAYDMAG
ncbi:type II toxin-antitoxin system MqsA family antitoxin [Chloroflexi bacterium CFX6]|nr:type II toxin-antitoxin system MqsA family antitoxin [Chloroflexi bacterium CFX6]